MANKETRIYKTDTLEQLRQKANEVSLHLGDNEQLASNLTDKTYDFVDVSAGDSLFQGNDDNAKTIRFEIKPAEVLDNTGGYIILKDVSSLTGFAAGDTLTQSGGYSATIVASSTEKILVKNSTGTFSSSTDITDGTNTIAHANVDRLIGESYNVGVVRVYKNGTELTQGLTANGFHVVSLRGTVPLSNTPDVSDITEGTVLNQSNGFTATVLRATSTLLLFKSYTGSFSAGANLRFSDNSTAIAASDHGALTVIDDSYGNAIELNTDASANDDIKIFSMDVVAAVNELQDDVGVTENLTTTATNLVNAVNEHDAELGTITDAAMGTTASTVSTAIREHEDQIGNANINAIATSDNTITTALNQLHSEVGDLSLNLSATDLTDAVNELEADLFNVEGGTKRTLGSLLTNDKTSIVDAINELHSELFVDGTGVAFTGLSADYFKEAIEELRTELGDHTALGTNTTTDAVSAINELETGIRGTNSNLVSTILTTTANDLAAAVNEHDAELGTITAGAMGTTASTVSGAIAEHETQIGNVDITTIASGNNTITGALSQLHTEIGDITAINGTFVNDSNLVAALNELQTEVGANAYVAGGPADTANPTNLTSAINAIDGEIGNTSYTGADITSAINTAQVLLGTEDITSIDSNSDTVTGALNQLHAEVGTVSLNSGLGSTLTSAVNNIQADINTAGSLTSLTTNNKFIVGAINEHETDIGNMTLTGVDATDLSAAVRELASEKFDRDSDTTQDIESSISFGANSSNKTLKIEAGSTLDVTEGSLLVGGGAGSQVAFDTAFIELTPNTNQRGLVFERSDYNASNPDVKIQWNENQVGNNKGGRAFQIVGLDDSGSAITSGVNNGAQDIVTFYNAKDLISSNSETGIDVTWDSANGNFDFALVADPEIVLSGDVAGSVTLTNLATGTYTITSTIQAGSVENSMLAGSIAASKLAGSIPNSKLTNSSITISDGTNTSPVALGGTLTFSNVSGETTVTENAGTVTIGLPNDVTIGNDLIVTGDLTVQGTNTILNTETLTVEDTLVLAGNNLSSEPSSGGFGLEVGPIITQTVNGAVSSSTSVTLDSGTGVLVGQGVYGTGVAAGATVSAISGTTLTLSTASSIADGTTLTFSHPTKASNVTGSHSIVYNYGYDNGDGTYGRWEADGSLILSSATLSTPQVEGSDFGPGDNLTFTAGTGLSESVSGFAVTYTNEDRGSSQNIFKTVSGNTGSISAGSNNSSFTISGGTSLTSSVSGTTLTINHDNFITAGTYGNASTEDGQYVKSVTVNAQGHVTAVTTDDFDDRYIRSFVLEDGDGTEVTIVDGKEFKFVEGAGDGASIDINFTDTSPGSDADPFDLSFAVTNTDKGSTQSIFKRVIPENDAGTDLGTITADNNNDILYIQSAQVDNTAGIALGVDAANDRLTISHANTSSAGNVSAANNTYVKSLNFDTYGHVTGTSTGSISATGLVSINSSGQISTTADNYGSWQLYVNNVSQDAITSGERVGFDEGSGIDLSWDGNDLTITHQDTSSQGSVNNSGNNFIQDITLDTFGHITGITSAGVGINDATITLDAGTDLSTGGNFTTNQGSAETITINHSDIGRTDNTSSTSPGFGGNFTAIDSVTTNARGHVTAVNTKTVTLPSPSYPTVNNATITISASGGLSGGAAFTTNQGFAETITITHADTSSQASVNNSGRTYIQDITLDTYGHVTGINSATETVVNTDTTYSAGNGISLSGTTFSVSAGAGLVQLTDGLVVESDQRGTIQSIGYNSSNTIHTDNGYISFRTNASDRFKMESDGDFHATGDIVAYSTTPSDERLKENIQVVDGALEKVSQLKGVTFDWKKDGRKSAGLIAQDVEKVLPTAVKEKELTLTHDDGEKYKVIEHSQVTALIVEAIKELKEENKLLKAEIESLKDINS